VLGTCFKYLKNKDNACDATMQIFEKLISDLKTNDINNFKSWLYTVSKNHCLMILRKETSIQKQIEIIRENTPEKFVEFVANCILIMSRMMKKDCLLSHRL